MPATVVDELEAVEVEEGDGHTRAVSLAPSQRLADAVHEQAPIREPGQGVVQGLMGEPVLRLLAGAGVADDALDGHDVAGVVGDDAQSLLDPDGGPVLAADLDLPGLAERRRMAQLPHHLDVLRLDHLEDQLGIGVELVGPVAGDRRARGRHVVEAGIGLEAIAEDEVLGVLGEQPEPLLAAAQTLLGHLALGDVGGDAGDCVRHAVGVEEGELDGQEGHRRVGIGGSLLELDGLQGLERTQVVGAEHGRVGRRPQLGVGASQHPAAIEVAQPLVAAVHVQVAAVEVLHVDDRRGGVDQVLEPLLGLDEGAAKPLALFLLSWRVDVFWQRFPETKTARGCWLRNGPSGPFLGHVGQFGGIRLASAGRLHTQQSGPARHRWWRFPAGTLSPVQVVANGNPVELPDGASVDDLLDALGLGAKWVVVERNGEPVPRRDVAATPLAEGDRLELVRAVAGG